MSRNKAKEALEQLKRDRQLGRTNLKSYGEKTQDQDETHRIYDEVTEEDYQLLRRKRLQDDFVVDDDGLGYADYGQDEDEDDVGGAGYSSEEEAEEGGAGGGKATKRKRAKTESQKSAQSSVLSNMFKNQMSKRASGKQQVVGPATTGTAAASKATGKTKAAEDNDDLSALLDQIDQASAAKVNQLHQQHQSTTRVSNKKEVTAGNRRKSLKKSAVLDSAWPLDSPTSRPGTQNDETVDSQDVPSFVADSMELTMPDHDNQWESTASQEEPATQGQSQKTVQAKKEPEEPERVQPQSNIKVVEKKTKQQRKPSTSIISARPLVAKPGMVAPMAPSMDTQRLTQQMPQGGWWQERQNVHGESAMPWDKSQTSAGSFSQPIAATPTASHRVFDQQQRVLMYWLDAFEGRDGQIFLFGKVWQPDSKKFASCCVTIGAMDRSVFVLPREFEVDSTGHQTDKEVDMTSIWEELDQLLTQNKIQNWSMLETRKKYAFEVPEVPVEADWLEISYPFKMPIFPVQKGRTFSHVFGSNTPALELFLIRSKLMGPCWIEIQEAVVSNLNVSWCQVELNVNFTTKDTDRIARGQGFNIRPLQDSDLDSHEYPDHCKCAPPLTVMSMSLKTVMNYRKNCNEIVMASILVYKKVSADSATSEEDQKDVSYFTTIRQLGDAVFPMGFMETIQQKQLKIVPQKTEMGMLNYIMAIFHLVDPDVLVGHNFLGFDLDVLLHRMKDLNIDHWSRLGRLRRNVFPKLQAGVGGMGETTYAERMVVSGRLICDTYLNAKDLIKSKNYALTTLTKNVLKMDRAEVNFETIPQFYTNTQDLLWLTQHTENDSYLAMKLVFHMMVLPLTKQLTNLAGNLWSRTLTGGRAERNEFLLLHEFTRHGYVVPDKNTNMPTIQKVDHTKSKNKKSKDRQAGVAPKQNTQVNMGDFAENEDEDDAPEVKKAGRRKPAYSGGLVLEPKKGFYDKFVVMLDFNSLYPSIIQEYNICFTTVDRKTSANGDLDELPELPDSSLEQGILPRLLATLVQRRRQVKSLMKNHDSKSSEYAQLNIRQQALKLTANSMYGCLGFTHSRFYAKPLAMLITSRGREILQDTVDLAEQTLGLEVIYGDTDSIMIYTATDNLAEVKAMGQKLKVAVNKKYKLLEIEMDGVFRRMLLLKKKKYAALTVTEGDNGVLTLTRETKGLDLVRRDWCELSHDVSNYVLNQILSDLDREDVLQNIHSHLTDIGTAIRDNQVPLEKFIINKSLTKAPEDYNDAKAQPHVQVALRMKAKGISARIGDTIPYIICKDEDPQKAVAARAYHIDEVKKEDSGLVVDTDYYLSHQLHPPISRLVQPMEGTDVQRIALCLGLDPSKFRSIGGNGMGGGADGWEGQDALTPFQSQISDEERFKHADRLYFNCTFCAQSMLFEGVVRRRQQQQKNGDTSGEDIYENGFTCLHCSKVLPVPSIRAQLNHVIRQHIRHYYEGWMVCDDTSCSLRTRQVSVLGRQCPNAQCRGTLYYEYSDHALYTQLLYYSTLLNIPRQLQQQKNNPSSDTPLSIWIQQHQLSPEYTTLLDQQVVQVYLNQNARGFVNLGKLFHY